MPLTQDQRSQVVNQTNFWIAKASALYGRVLTPIDVRFDLRGKTSGMFCVKKTGFKYTRYIRYNDRIFARYFSENIEQTIPHEVAHYTVYEMFGRSAKPHGSEWRKVMQDFGVSAAVTSKLDVDDLATRKLKRFIYRCACGERELTSIRHNRIQRGARNYGCPRCKQILEFIG